MNYKIIDGEKVYSYRWVILALLFLAVVVVNGCTLIFAGMAPSLLAPAEAGGYGWTSQQFMLANSCSYLTGFLFCILCGTLADRKGLKKVMCIGLGITLVGAILRCFCTDFPAIFACSVVMGFGLAALNANSAKMIRLWFPGKMVGVAMGIYLCGATLGCAVSVPVAGAVGMTPTFIGVAVLSAVTFVAWVLLYKKHPDNEHPIVEPVVSHLGKVMKSKNLWVACLVIGFVMAAGAVNNGYLVAMLSSAKGVDPTVATLVSSACNITCSVGGLLFPIICAKTHNEKKWLVGLGVVVIVFIAVYMFALDGMATAIGVVVCSVLVGGILPLAKSLPAQLPDITREHMGAAGGLHSTIQNLFAFVIPSYVVAPLCGTDYMMLNGAAYMILIGLMVISAVFLPKLMTGGSAPLEDE